MDKVLVSVIVPAVEQKFDVRIPTFMKIEEIIGMIAEALAELTQQNYISSGCELLCSSDRQMVFDVSMTIADVGIQNGDVLFFI